MRAVLFAVALAGACRGASSHPVDVVSVYAFAGDTDPEVEADVVSHDASGQPVDGQSTDASGHTEIAIVAGGTITVAFPGAPSPTTPAISVVTVLAPEAGGEVDIHGPPHANSPAAAGVLLVQPPAFTADAFSVELGCTETPVASFPASIDVSTLCVTSDANLDILVLARTSGQITGYVAGRVPLQDGFAMFQPAAWQTTAPTVPVSNTTAAQLAWSLRSDGMSFGGQVVMTSAPLYTGLKIDGAQLVASIGQGQVTTREIAGAPTDVSVDTSDFLQPAAGTIAFDGTRTYNWAQLDIGASVMNLHLEYDGSTAHIVWDVVLPPSATGIAMPALGGDLSALVPEPTASADTTLQYVQGATDAGVYLEAPTGLSSVAQLPTDGEIRTTRIHGL